jgi:hypothetical protein
MRGKRKHSGEPILKNGITAMPIDPLLPLIMAHRPLALNNRTRAKSLADLPIDARNLAQTRERLAAAILEQIEFAQAEALARAGWHDGEATSQIAHTKPMLEQK